MRIYLLLLCLFSLTTFAQTVAPRFSIPADEQVHTTLGQPTHNEKLNPNRINVLVWNIYKGEKQAWEKSYKNFLTDQDIVLTQEIYLNDKMKKVFSEGDYLYDCAISFFDAKNFELATGVATASKVKADKVLWQRSAFREPITKTPKMTLFTSYPLAGTSQKLLVGNMHGINFVSFKKLKHQLIKAAELIKRHNGPVLFAGDFNTWTATKMNAMIEVLQKVGLKPVRFAPDFRKSFMGHALDHVWVKNLEVLMAQAPENEGSDHNPMVISVKTIEQEVISSTTQSGSDRYP